MSLYVVDSSVAIKWYVPEVLSDKAILLQTCGIPLHAPDFVDVELAAVAWKKMRRDGMPRNEAEFIVSQLPNLPVTKHLTVPLVGPAFDIADRSGRTVYDCVYLALARQLGGKMITADDRLVNALTGTPWAMYVMKLQDVP